MITRENHEWDDALGTSPTPWFPHPDLNPEVPPVSDQDFPPYETQKSWSIQEADALKALGEAHPWIRPKESVCAEADRLTSTERGHNYGHPLDDFGKVVGMAQALWGRGPETEEEHALYMILVKLSRLANNPDHRDSLVDIAGYAKTYEMILDERKKDSGFA